MTANVSTSLNDITETAERYAELQRAVDAHCPVLDLSTAATPVETTLITA